jgi:chromosomal replication initiation ATPase DnaA
MMKSAVVQIQPRPAAPHVSFVREQAWLVQVTVSHVTGVALKELCARTRGHPKAAFARQVAMYLCHVVLEMNLTDVARAFGRDRSTAAYAFRHIEELREDPEHDRTLIWYEAMLRRSGWTQ